MKLRIELPPEGLDEIVDRITERVLVELAANDRFPAQGTRSPYLSVDEAAEYLRCSRQRIDDLLSQGKLARVKDGRRTLVERAEVERHLASSTARARH